MLEKLTFQNHKGKTFSSAENGIFANYSKIHDYLWEYTTSDVDKITQFERGVVKRTIPLVIMCSSEEQGLEVRNELMNIAEKDVLDMLPGKLIINGYYMPLYIIGSSKAKYLYSMRYMEATLTVLTDNPVWTKETVYSFYPNLEVVEDDSSATTMDYPYDYSYEYVNTYGKWKIQNTSFVASKFEMIIYGRAVNPAVVINGHIYEVQTTISDNERIVINSRDKTVVKIDAYGNETNIYNSRGKTYSIFEPIPTGMSVVTWDGEWGFDITLYDERSEPEWSL